MIKVEVQENEVYWKPIQEFMDKMYEMGGHVSPVHYYEYLFEELKPIIDQMSDYDKEMFAELLTKK